MMLHDVLLSLSDAEALSALLDAHRRADSSDSEAAEALAEVLAHARRVPDQELPADRVALGSGVTYAEEPSGARRTWSLAFPADADLARGRISVLSPIGRALVGRRRGELVDAELPGGRIVTLQVLGVRPHREELREAA
jgi:regulator of nucleoside diphosphate kinase